MIGLWRTLVLCISSHPKLTLTQLHHCLLGPCLSAFHTRHRHLNQLPCSTWTLSRRREKGGATSTGVAGAPQHVQDALIDVGIDERLEPRCLSSTVLCRITLAMATKEGGHPPRQAWRVRRALRA